MSSYSGSSSMWNAAPSAPAGSSAGGGWQATTARGPRSPRQASDLLLGGDRPAAATATATVASTTSPAAATSAEPAHRPTPPPRPASSFIPANSTPATVLAPTTTTGAVATTTTTAVPAPAPAPAAVVAPCRRCGCTDMMPNPFCTNKCLNCSHIHTAIPRPKGPHNGSMVGANRIPGSAQSLPSSRGLHPVHRSLPVSGGELPIKMGPHPGLANKGTAQGTTTPAAAVAASAQPAAVAEAEKKADKPEDDKKRKKKKGGEDEFTITGPTSFRRGAHIGVSEEGKFETSNLPPEMAKLLEAVNTRLGEMGQRPMTASEAGKLLANKDVVEKLAQKTQQPPAQQTAAHARPVSTSVMEVYNPMSVSTFNAQCPKCGAPITQEQPFCMGCGSRVNKRSKKAEPAAPATTTDTPVATTEPVVAGKPSEGTTRKAMAMETFDNLRKRARGQEEKIAQLQEELVELKSTKELLASTQTQLKELTLVKDELEKELSQVKCGGRSSGELVSVDDGSRARLEEEIAALQRQLANTTAANTLDEDLEKEKHANTQLRQRNELLEKEKQALLDSLSGKDMELNELRTKLKMTENKGVDSDKKVEAQFAQMKVAFEEQLKRAKEVSSREGELRAGHKFTPELESKARTIDELQKKLLVATSRIEGLEGEVRALKTAATKATKQGDSEFVEYRKKSEEALAKVRQEKEESISRLKSTNTQMVAHLEGRLSTKDDRIRELENEVDRLMSSFGDGESAEAAPETRVVAEGDAQTGVPPPPPPPPPPGPAAPRTAGGPPPPPPPPPPSSSAGQPAGAGRAGLLSAIQSGTALRKVDPAEQKKGPDMGAASTTGASGGGGVLAGGDLASILANALVSRRADTKEDGDEGSDEDGDEWEDED